MGSRAKVLLMGRSGSGKTSMRSVVFASYLARDTARLTPTLDVEHSNVRFLGGLVLSLWDCGGQHAFYDSYFSAQREHIFAGAAALIYVFDVASAEGAADLRLFAGAVEALAQFSGSDVRLMVLLHKMDLVPAEARAPLVAARAAAIRAASRGLPLQLFATSIFDESLYRAWSAIVHSLIPNVAALEGALAGLAAACDAEEVVLFERATFLVISHATRGGGGSSADAHRFEKISNIVKAFKLSCAKSKAQLRALRAGSEECAVFIEPFTANTIVMVVTSDEAATDEATLLNLSIAKPVFERIIAAL